MLVAIATAASCDRSRSCQKFNALRKIASLSRATVKIIKLRGYPKRPGNPIGFRAHRLNIETPVRCHAVKSVRKTHRNNDMQNATKHRFSGNTRDETTKRQNGRHRPRRVSRLYSVEMLEPATSSKRHSEAAGRLHPETVRLNPTARSNTPPNDARIMDPRRNGPAV